MVLVVEGTSPSSLRRVACSEIPKGSKALPSRYKEALGALGILWPHGCCFLAKDLEHTCKCSSFLGLRYGFCLGTPIYDPSK